MVQVTDRPETPRLPSRVDHHRAIAGYGTVVVMGDANEESIFVLDTASSRSPLAKSTRNPRTSKRRHTELWEATEELGHRVHEVQDSEARTLYRGLSSEDQISSFLETDESGYTADRGLWAILPEDPAGEHELCNSFTKIFNAAIEFFHPCISAGVTRVAIDTHELSMAHDNGRHFTKPSICIKATGPSFEIPERAAQPNGVGYTNITSAIDVKLDNARGKRKVHCKRLSLFNRQIFIQQPNRHFARSLLLTEKVFRLVHFDRSGVYVTPLFDIHKDASLLVQFIVGLTSPNEQESGLDTSVQWTIDDASGRKISGTIKVEEHDDNTKKFVSKTYDLDLDEPPFVRPGIRGRGTIVWHAKDPVTGGGIVIKDAWRKDSRKPEYEFLLKAKGLLGIVQMLGFQDDCAQTAQFRTPCFESDEFRNLSKLRIVLHKYGSSVWFFRSRLQLFVRLSGMFSSRVGHCKLFEGGVIHRDISMLNILLGAPGAPEGHRGVLIDLDSATSTQGHKSSLPADPYIVRLLQSTFIGAIAEPDNLQGTRMYQSTSALEDWKMDPPPPLDYMDELESLFYVYCHLLHAFEKPGIATHKGINRLEYWDADDLALSVSAKTTFSLSATKVGYVSSYWGGACTTLFREFHSVIRDAINEKNTIHADMDLDVEAKNRALDEVANSFRDKFEKVKAAFEKAIAQLEKEGPNAEELEPYPEAFSSLHLPSSTSTTSKQPPSDAEDDSVVYLLSTESDSPESKKRPLEEDAEHLPQKRPRKRYVRKTHAPPTRQTVPARSAASGKA
ncbi:hypothetical protein NMY22_g1035 [Coprinellus aureogranulatus]|nr:hypothetical protein NMY22_g1035 [Coprinellus aureogranulatus]